MTAIRLPILCLLAATAVAQDNTAANRFVPADAQLVLRVASPTKWASRFANTKIGQVFSGEALAPMIEGMTSGFDEGITKAKDAGVDAELLDELFNKYTGDLIVALRLDLDDLPSAMEEERPPAMAITFALTPDGSFDLAGLTQSIAKVIEEDEDNAARIREVVVGDHTLRVDRKPDGEMSVPSMIDGHMVMMFATDMESYGATMLATDNRSEATGADIPLYFRAETQRTLTTVLDFVNTMMADDPMAPAIDPQEVMNKLGLSCLRSLNLSLTADGDQAVMETNLATDSENHGLFGALLLDQGSPKTLRYLPVSANAFSCQAFDIGAIYKSITGLWTALDEIMPMSFEDVELAFEDATKVRLREDLIDHLGTEVLYLADYESEREMYDEGIEATITQILGGSCYAIALRDGKAFGESLEKALRSRGLHAARKSDEYQGVKVYRLRVGGIIEIEYSVTDDLLLLALGSDESARTQLRSILDARANPTAGIPDIIAEHANKMPAGWNGVGLTPIATLMQSIGTAIKEAGPGDIPPEAAMLIRVMGTIGAEMKQVGLENAVQFTWASATGLRTITRL